MCCRPSPGGFFVRCPMQSIVDNCTPCNVAGHHNFISGTMAYSRKQSKFESFARSVRGLTYGSDLQVLVRLSEAANYVCLASCRGWRLFPAPTDCRVREAGFSDASCDLTQLARGANNQSGFCRSLATGSESGQFVLEAQAVDGLNSLRRPCQLDWHETLCAESTNYLVAFLCYPAGMPAFGVDRIEIVRGLTVVSDGENIVQRPPGLGIWLIPDAPALESPQLLNKCTFGSIKPDSLSSRVAVFRQ